jgi:hypothetical protein
MRQRADKDNTRSRRNVGTVELGQKSARFCKHRGGLRRATGFGKAAPRDSRCASGACRQKPAGRSSTRRRAGGPELLQHRACSQLTNTLSLERQQAEGRARPIRGSRFLRR